LHLVDLIGGTIAGVVVLLFIGGWIWAKPAVDALIRSLEQKDQEILALRRSIEERIIPVLEENTQLADRVVRLLEDRAQTDRALLDAVQKHDRPR
jgi:hypothetical protein